MFSFMYFKVIIMSKIIIIFYYFQDMKYDNCEELFPGVLQVSWKILEEHLYMQMAGKVGKNLKTIF